MTDADLQLEAFAVVLKEERDAGKLERDKLHAALVDLQEQLTRVQPGSHSVTFPAPQVRVENHIPAQLPPPITVEAVASPPAITVQPSTAIIENKTDLNPEIVIDMTPVAKVLAEALARVIALLENRPSRTWKITRDANGEMTGAEVSS